MFADTSISGSMGQEIENKKKDRQNKNKNVIYMYYFKKMA